MGCLEANLGPLEANLKLMEANLEHLERAWGIYRSFWERGGHSRAFTGYLYASGSDCEACKGHLGASGGYFRAFGGQPSSVLPIKWKFDLRNAVSHLMRMKLKGTLSLNGHNLVIF